MEHKTRTKALSWLFSLAMGLSLLPGMSLTAPRCFALRLSAKKGLQKLDKFAIIDHQI